jgi:hypothetical protein
VNRSVKLTGGRCRRGGGVGGSISPSSSMPRTGARRRPPSSLKSKKVTGPGTTMARASNCSNFSTLGIRQRSPKGASFPRRFFLEGGGNARPAPVLLRRPGATFGADDGSRTRMAEGRGILSPLRLPVSPRPLAAMGFSGASNRRQAPFRSAWGKASSPLVSLYQTRRSAVSLYLIILLLSLFY